MDIFFGAKVLIFFNKKKYYRIFYANNPFYTTFLQMCSVIYIKMAFTLVKNCPIRMSLYESTNNGRFQRAVFCVIFGLAFYVILTFPPNMHHQRLLISEFNVYLILFAIMI